MQIYVKLEVTLHDQSCKFMFLASYGSETSFECSNYVCESILHLTLLFSATVTHKTNYRQLTSISHDVQYCCLVHVLVCSIRK